MGESTLKQELPTEYNRLLVDLPNVVADEQLTALQEILDRVPDDCEDLFELLDSNADVLRNPRVWSDYLRLLRFSMLLKAEFAGPYDEFIKAYQMLSGVASPTNDQRKLLSEIGDLMYKIDELFGDYERLSDKIIQQVSASLKETYGVLLEPLDDLHSTEAHEDHAFRLSPHVKELVKFLADLKDLRKIKAALLRMRKLIVDF